MKRSPQDLAEMAAAIDSHEAAARLWLDEGFSPGDAAAYVAADCFDVPRKTELRQAGISALDIARTGLAWDYCSGSPTLAGRCSGRKKTPTQSKLKAIQNLMGQKIAAESMPSARSSLMREAKPKGGPPLNAKLFPRDRDPRRRRRISFLPILLNPL